MKVKQPSLVPILAVLAALFLAGCGDDRSTYGELVAEDDVVLVEVDGRPVTLGMLEFHMEARGIEEDDTEGMRAALDELIRMRAVANRAEESGLADREAIRAERAVKDFALLYRRWLDERGEQEPVSEADLRAAYEAQLQRAGDTRFRLRTVAFPSRQAAVEAIEALGSGGEDFDAVVDEATADGRSVREPGWVDASQFPADFAARLAATEPGRTVRGPLAMGPEWLVVHVEETEPLDPPAFEDVREGIRRSLERSRTRERIEESYEAAEIVPVLPVGEQAGG
ncbi:MAG: peptidylprolyl isomerase [Wenzhouxiangellaceae bacterium]|nr:peptidylprolyl isomerase [Wenzhouxiangellaceae bacterium]